jgi:hypothetical protein
MAAPLNALQMKASDSCKIQVELSNRLTPVRKTLPPKQTSMHIKIITDRQ